MTNLIFKQDKSFTSYPFNPIGHLCWWRKVCAAFALKRCSLCPHCANWYRLTSTSTATLFKAPTATGIHRTQWGKKNEQTNKQNKNTGTQPQLSPSSLQSPPPDTGVHFPFGGRQHPPHHFWGTEILGRHADRHIRHRATVTQHTSTTERPEETPFLTPHIDREGGSHATWSL